MQCNCEVCQTKLEDGEYFLRVWGILIRACKECKVNDNIVICPNGYFACEWPEGATRVVVQKV